MITFVATVRGRLPEHWHEWCAGLTTSPRTGHALRLTGRVADQVAMMGVLSRLHALNVQIDCCTFRQCSCPPDRCTCLPSWLAGDETP